MVAAALLLMKINTHPPLPSDLLSMAGKYYSACYLMINKNDEGSNSYQPTTSLSLMSVVGK